MSGVSCGLNENTLSTLHSHVTATTNCLSFWLVEVFINVLDHKQVHLVRLLLPDEVVAGMDAELDESSIDNVIDTEDIQCKQCKYFKPKTVQIVAKCENSR